MARIGVFVSRLPLQIKSLRRRIIHAWKVTQILMIYIYNENTGFLNVMISQCNDSCLCLDLNFAL